MRDTGRNVKEVSIFRAGKNLVLPDLPGETLEVILSDGTALDIELFERQPGVLQIKCDGQLLVLPEYSNSIGVKVGK